MSSRLAHSNPSNTTREKALQKMAFSFTQTSITARIVVVAVSNRDIDNGRCSSTVVLVSCRSGRLLIGARCDATTSGDDDDAGEVAGMTSAFGDEDCGLGAFFE